MSANGRYSQTGCGTGAVAASDDHWWLNADKMTRWGALIAFGLAYLWCTKDGFSIFRLFETVVVWFVLGPLGALCGYILRYGLAVIHKYHLVDFCIKILGVIERVLGIVIVGGCIGIFLLLRGLWKLSLVAWRKLKNRYAHRNGAATASHSGRICASRGASAPVIDVEYHSAVEEAQDDSNYGYIVQHKAGKESRSYDA